MTACILALEDGSVFAGNSVGASGTRTGEVVFNTAMTGYQEILTDPSYAGQIVTMTAPLIGNYGVNEEDIESSAPCLAGFVVRELARRHSNSRAAGGLSDYLRACGVIGLAGVDTRALTRRLRAGGAMRSALSTELLDPLALIDLARRAEPMTGRNLVGEVSPAAEGGRRRAAPQSTSTRRVVVIDCGVKRNILRLLETAGCEVLLAGSEATAEAILERRPHGVLVSNGPGDPAAVTVTVENLGRLVGRVPIFGICMGCQLTALAIGARTYKMKFGHHGANHPVINHASGHVEITSQNHGFAVDEDSLLRAGGRVTHTSLYDRSVEGFAHDELRVVGVQYHPEAAPGPQDSRYLFEEFTHRL